MAAVAPSEDCVRLLVESGADTGFIVSGQLTLLHICAEQGLSTAVQAILNTSSGKKTACVINDDGNAPIHLAAMSENIPVVEMLLPHSTDVLPADITVEAIIADGKIRLEQWRQKHQSADNSSNNNTESKRAPEMNASEVDVSNITVSTPSQADSEKSEELKNEANVLFKEKKFVEAYNMYSQATTLNNSNHILWSNRSACAVEIAEGLRRNPSSTVGPSRDEWLQIGLRDALMCRRLAPSWPKGAFRLATARFALGMFEEAAVAAFEGCKLDDSNVELKGLLKLAVEKGKEEYQKSQSRK
jgi:ankyrin repeat protein